MLVGSAQVAALELEGQRMQLEQQDAADQQTSPEALQRLQQQVIPTCTLHSAKAKPAYVFGQSCTKACESLVP